ncbi:Probable peptide synthetase NRP [Mycobacteroides abscessus subsp. abscessus]|nr:Probable peptide synthetase NRP [Mycobacteroides abscessus subsp. abscessus]
MDLLDDDDHDRLDEWGNRAVLTEPAAEPVSIPVVFAVQVERAPETVALVCRDRSWTYRELDQITNRIAHLLASPRRTWVLGSTGRGVVTMALTGL